MRELANTICPYLQMEEDFPSNHSSGWMPILNLEVRVSGDKSIDYKWYKKPMASPYTILNRSAMPASTKRITLVQMGVTMLRNTRLELQEELRIPMMEHLAETMFISGYPEDFRRGVIESAVKCFEKQVAASLSGETPLFRPRAWQLDARQRKKLLAKSAWFRPADSVMRVPCTPGALLVTQVRKVVEEESKRLGLRIKVQEGAGVSLRRSLTTTDLKAGEPCPQGDCPLCLTGEGKGGLHHHRSGAVYQGECLLCGDLVAKYWGESGDSAYCRALQHQKSIANREEKNAFAKHLLIHHPNQQGKQDAFKFSLLEVHKKPLPRLVSESCYIYNNEADHLMNSKAEWNQPLVPRVVVSQELEELEEQAGSSRGQQEGSRRGGRGRQRRRGGA